MTGTAIEIIVICFTGIQGLFGFAARGKTHKDIITLAAIKGVIPNLPEKIVVVCITIKRIISGSTLQLIPAIAPR